MFAAAGPVGIAIPWGHAVMANDETGQSGFGVLVFTPLEVFALGTMLLMTELAARRSGA